MKAWMENLPLQDPGIIVESETPEERIRLENIWSKHGGIVVFTRLGGGNVQVVIAPEKERDGARKVQ